MLRGEVSEPDLVSCCTIELPAFPEHIEGCIASVCKRAAEDEASWQAPPSRHHPTWPASFDPPAVPAQHVCRGVARDTAEAPICVYQRHVWQCVVCNCDALFDLQGTTCWTHDTAATVELKRVHQPAGMRSCMLQLRKCAGRNSPSPLPGP